MNYYNLYNGLVKNNMPDDLIKIFFSYAGDLNDVPKDINNDPMTLVIYKVNGIYGKKRSVYCPRCGFFYSRNYINRHLNTNVHNETNKYDSHPLSLETIDIKNILKNENFPNYYNKTIDIISISPFNT
jgi:hypothetical protein